MKIITLLLMMLSISVAQAKVYKCPSKKEGQYTYQEKPCKGAKADEHTIKITPFDEKKVAEARAKLNGQPATPAATEGSPANSETSAPANAAAQTNPTPPVAAPVAPTTPAPQN